MDSVMITGLRISALSYVLIFVVLGTFYGLIKLLLRTFPSSKEPR